MGRSKKVEDERERAPEWALPMRMRTSEADEEIRSSSPSSPSVPMVVGDSPCESRTSPGKPKSTRRGALFVFKKKRGDPLPPINKTQELIAVLAFSADGSWGLPL